MSLHSQANAEACESNAVQILNSPSPADSFPVFGASDTSVEALQT